MYALMAFMVLQKLFTVVYNCNLFFASLKLRSTNSENAYHLIRIPFSVIGRYSPVSSGSKITVVGRAFEAFLKFVINFKGASLIQLLFFNNKVTSKNQQRICRKYQLIIMDLQKNFIC